MNDQKDHLDRLARLRSRTGLPLLECRRLLTTRSQADIDRLLNGIVDDSGRVHDAIEFDPSVEELIRLAEMEAQNELAIEDIQGQTGYCHVFWSVKQHILRERYGIDWRTPAEMNPGSVFD